MEGTWKGSGGEVLIATASHLAAMNAPGLPSGARYRLEEGAIHFEPLEGMAAPKPSKIVLKALTSSQMTFIMPGETTETVWGKVE